MIQKVEIDANKPLQPGDRIELHFNTVGMTWLQAAQIALVEWRLKNRKEFTIESWQIQDKTKLIFTVRVNKTNPVAVTAVIIATAIAGVGIVAWLTLDKVYQIMESPAGEIAVSGIGSIAIAIAVALVVGLLGKK